MGALSMALTLLLQVSVRDVPMQPLFTLAGNVIFAGALLGLGAVLIGGSPLVVSAWRSTPRSRFLLIVPLLAIVLSIPIFILLKAVMGAVFHPTMDDLFYPLQNARLALVFYGVPIISTIAINRTIRQAPISDKWLRFARLPSRLVVFGMLLMLIGVLLWGFSLALLTYLWNFLAAHLPRHVHSRDHGSSGVLLSGSLLSAASA
jgi:hypothetical protein